MTLVEAIRDIAARRPDAVAIIDPTTSLTWSALDRGITRAAVRLHEHGIRPGDRVLLDLDRAAGFAVAYFAVHAAGAVCVIAGADATTADAIAVRAEATIIVTSGDARPDSAARPAISIDRLCAAGPERGALPDLNELGPDAIADILYTTGTTGEPKGVVLTHAHVIAAARNIASYVAQREQDIEVCPLPLTHSFGLGRLRALALTGHTLVIEPMRAIGELLDAVRRTRATCLALAPASLALLRRVRADADVVALAPTLRFIELGSAAVAPDLREWACDRLAGVRLCHHYGSTEASRAAFVDLASDDARAGSVGRAAPDVTIDARDATGAPLDAGRDGELWIRGPMVAREYWRQPELTAASFVGGAVRTLDVGRVDRDGRVFLTGRLSELIHVGGIKLAPETIEAELAAHPDIVDVACTAMADPQGITGERVAAFVVASRELALPELRTWLSARGVDSHRMPVYVECVASLPRTAAGKLLRRTLIRSR